MTNSIVALKDTQRVWRYMSFARFLWMLQKKQLWLSRADLLGDDWEIALAGEQLKHVIATRPITPISEPMPTESIMERAKRIIQIWRRNTFVSCWSAADHESHALWSIYCKTSEGVAIQTSLGKLRGSVGELRVLPVQYGIPGENRHTPTVADLVTKKRPMYDYEKEVRVVRFHDDANPDPPQEVPGRMIDWDAEKIIESIRIHPDADASFREAVISAVDHCAPGLKERIVWSDMRDPPPC